MAETIGERIQRFREAKGWTPFKLCVESEVQEQSIRLYEKGRVPGIEILERIACALDVTLDELVKGLAVDSATK